MVKGKVIINRDMYGVCIQCIFAGRRLFSFAQRNQPEYWKGDNQADNMSFMNCLNNSWAWATNLTWNCRYAGNKFTINGDILIGMTCFIWLQGQHVSVTGPGGCGKSALLLSITGELQKITGSISSQGRISFVPQYPWIFSGTVRENILFGQELNKQRYNKVLNACGLVKVWDNSHNVIFIVIVSTPFAQELDTLTNGDITMVDNEGSPLNKVQMIKMTIARLVHMRWNMLSLSTRVQENALQLPHPFHEEVVKI